MKSSRADNYSPAQQRILRRVQANIPMTMLMEPCWQDFVFALGVNPEIGLDATALDRYGESEFRDIAEKLHGRGLSITIHGPFMDLSPGSPDPLIREVTGRRFRQLLGAVKILQPRAVVCHAGYDAARYAFIREQWLAASIGTWQWLATALAGRGSRLMLENVYEKSPDDLLAILENFSTELVGCCLDVGHQSVFSPAPLSEWLNRLGPWIKELHLHDNNGDYDAHLPIGRGSIDFTPVTEFLASCAPVPILTLEQHREEDLRTTLEQLTRHPLV